MQSIVLEPEFLIPTISTNYNLSSPLECEFIRRGFNDHYLVKTAGERYIFRVYLRDKYYISSPDDFRFELEFLTFLAGRGVPVAEPIEAQNGGFLVKIQLPENVRFAALFRFAEGVELAKYTPKTPELSERLGGNVAKLHLYADSFKTSYSRYHLDFRYLIDEPLQTLEKHLLERGKGDLNFFKPFAAELKAQISQLPKASTYGIIHADLHGRNIHYDDKAGFCIFDFDHCAYGWRAYDFATFSDIPAERWMAFLEGYESVRPLSQLEKDAIPAFTKLRAIWDIGDILNTFPLWGKTPDDDYLEESVNRLRNLK
jgi:Ser/Thr protein kinase RdoA (MazF antagonist)